MRHAGGWDWSGVCEVDRFDIIFEVFLLGEFKESEREESGIKF